MFNYNRQVKRPAIRLLNKLLSSDMAINVVYKKFESTSFDNSTGKNVSVYSEYSVDTIRSSPSLEAQLSTTVLSGVGFETGTMTFVFKQSDVPRTDLYDTEILKDYIVVNGKDYQVKGCAPVFDIFVRIQV